MILRKGGGGPEHGSTCLSLADVTFPAVKSLWCQRTRANTPNRCTAQVFLLHFSNQADKDEGELDDIGVDNGIETPQESVADAHACRDNDADRFRQPKNKSHCSS